MTTGLRNVIAWMMIGGSRDEARRAPTIGTVARNTATGPKAGVTSVSGATDVTASPVEGASSSVGEANDTVSTAGRIAAKDSAGIRDGISVAVAETRAGADSAIAETVGVAETTHIHHIEASSITTVKPRRVTDTAIVGTTTIAIAITTGTQTGITTATMVIGCTTTTIDKVATDRRMVAVAVKTTLNADHPTLVARAAPVDHPWPGGRIVPTVPRAVPVQTPNAADCHPATQPVATMPKSDRIAPDARPCRNGMIDAVTATLASKWSSASNPKWTVPLRISVCTTWLSPPLSVGSASCEPQSDPAAVDCSSSCTSWPGTGVGCRVPGSSGDLPEPD